MSRSLGIPFPGLHLCLVRAAIQILFLRKISPILILSDQFAFNIPYQIYKNQYNREINYINSDQRKNQYNYNLQIYQSLSEIKIRMSQSTVNFTLTSSNILSQLYNNIKIPKKTPKCVICQNKKFQQEFQLKNGFKNPVEQPQVQTFLCNFCQKILEPKCQKCFKSHVCCNYSQPIKYEEFYSNLKKQCLKVATNISNIFKSFSSLSSKDIGFQNKDFPTMSSISNKIMIMINKIQQDLGCEIQKTILQNNKILHDIYKNYQNSIKNRFFNQKNKEKSQNYTIQQLYKFSRQIQKDKNDLQFQGSKVCEQYILCTSQNYCKILYAKIAKQLKTILIPQANQKDALVQTLPIAASSSANNQLFSNHNQLNEKVASLQGIIKKNLQTVSTLTDRIKDLEFIISLQQQKNQQNEMRIIELQAKCGYAKGDDSIQESFQDSKDKTDLRNDKNQKVLHRSQIFRGRLKQSKSASNLLTYSHLSQIKGKDKHQEQNYLHLDSSMQKN